MLKKTASGSMEPVKRISWSVVRFRIGRFTLHVSRTKRTAFLSILGLCWHWDCLWKVPAC